MATRYMRADADAAEVPEGRSVEEVAFVWADGTVHGAPEGSGGSGEVADGSVTTAKIADGAVTAAKMAPGVIPEAYVLPAATSGALGGVKQASAVADATDDAVSTLNSLLASLRAAGILANS